MTILESLKANPIFSDLEENAINVKLISRSIDGSVGFTSDSTQEVELISADLYLELANVASIKEGQLGITYNPEALIRLAKGIYKRYNDPKYRELFGARIVEVAVTKVQ